jgi:hypothetical protein
MSCEYSIPIIFTSLTCDPDTDYASRVLFITSVLGAVWAIATLFRRKSTRNSAYFVAFVDLAFVGAFIASVFELRGISSANCSNFSSNGDYYVSLGPNGFSGNSPFSANINKTCAMLKASFAFGIMNCIFFFITSFLLLFMHRTEDKEVVVKETYRRRSHDSRYAFASLFKSPQD